jgi:hypothetical protein
MRKRRIICGLYSPPSRANRMGIKAYNLFPSDRGKQGRLLCARRCG